MCCDDVQGPGRGWEVPRAVIVHVHGTGVSAPVTCPLAEISYNVRVEIVSRQSHNIITSSSFEVQKSAGQTQHTTSHSEPDTSWIAYCPFNPQPLELNKDQKMVWYPYKS